MGKITIDLCLVFEIPESGLTINGVIGGLKHATGQIHGKMVEIVLRALEERLIEGIGTAILSAIGAMGRRASRVI